METSDLDALARRSGFDGLDELRELLLCLRLRSPVERRAYERWAAQDGSKAGLLELLEAGAPSAGREPGASDGAPTCLRSSTEHVSARVRQ